MKLAEYDGKVESSSGIKSRPYSIATNRKSFEVLSKSLYSDRIGAVIRELSTNAADANIAAELCCGRPTKPFVVHLPNKLEPFFSVEDFATGMSHEEINDLYTTYFASNRNLSNRFTGALGLGSKSPFTYGDQFTVVSTVNGERRTYTCYVTKEGMPDVAPMAIDTDEDGNDIFIAQVDAPNGVLVKVPVELKDISEFESKAVNILRWFHPKPEVVGSANFKCEDYDYLIKNDLFGMAKVNRGRSHVVMGNVGYVLTPYDLQDLAQHEIALLNWGVDIWVEIGDVEIAANREKLTYTPDTKKTIKMKLTEIAKSLRQEANKFLQRAKTIWEARRLIFDYKKGMMGVFLENVKLEWQGKKISTCIYFERYSGSPTLCELAYRGSIHRGKNYPVLRSGPTNHVEADGSPIFIDDVVPVGGRKKIAYYMATNSIDKAYILSASRQIVKKTKKEDIDDEDDDTTGEPPIEESGLYETAVLASTLPDVPKMPRKPGDPGTHNYYTKLMLYNPDGREGDHKSYWSNAKVDIDDGGVYVVMCRFNIINGGIKDVPQKYNGDWAYRRPRSCVDAVRCLAALDDPVDVYGVKPSNAAMMEKARGWETLRAHVKAFLEEAHDEYMPRVIKSLQFATASECNDYLRLKGDDFEDASPFVTFHTALYEAKKENESKEVKAYITLRGWAGHQVENEVSTRQRGELMDLYHHIQKIYPLLKLVTPSNITKDTVKHLTQYIQLLDATRTGKKLPTTAEDVVEEVAHATQASA